MITALPSKRDISPLSDDYVYQQQETISSDYENTLIGPTPPYCECAYIAKRPLSWATWVPRISRNKPGGILDRYNLEFSHEHIIFQQSKDNIGFGPTGLFSEKIDQYNYRAHSQCYNGETMRLALAQTAPPTTYSWWSQNCQYFIQQVKDAYNTLSRKYLP